MTIAARVRSALAIQIGEERLVALVLSYGFALGMGRALCATAISGLFLSIYGAQAMPFVFIGTALVVPFTGIAYLRLQSRMTLARQIAGTLVLLMLALLVLRAALAASTAPWLVMSAMIGYTILYVLVTLAFWGLSGQIFNVRQAKRLFGLLGSGSELADIVGGLLTILLAPRIGSLNLLFLSASAILAALVVQRTITRRSADQLAANAAEAQAEPAPKLPVLLKNQYVRLILALIALSQIAYFFVENIFYDLSMAHFRGPEQFAGLVGGTIAATSIATLLLQIGVAGRLAHRYGIRVTQVVLPIALLLGASAVAVSGTLLGSSMVVFAIMLATRVGERALRFSVEESSVQIAYQPLPAAQRSLVQTLVAGGVKPLAAGLAGIAILIGTRLLGFGGVELAYVLILICIGWTILAIAAGRAYAGALVQAMSQRRLSGASLDLNDNTSLAIVQRSLHSPHPAEALYALDLLAEHALADRVAALAILLNHPDAQVRRIALQQIEQQRSAELSAAVADLSTHDPDSATRGQALRTLAVLGYPDTPARIAAALEDSDQQIRLHAIVAFARTGDQQHVKTWLQAHAGSDDITERMLAAQAIGEIGDSGWAGLLQQLLNDPAMAVRCAAISAVGRLQTPALWPQVIAALDQPQTHGAASAALVAGGEVVRHALDTAFGASNATHERRLAIARICGRIGGSMGALLSEALDDPHDEILRQQVISVLAQSGYRAEGQITARVEQQINADVAQATRLMAAQRDLGQHVALVPLQAALDRSLNRCRERVFGLLSIVFDAQTVRRAYENLSHSSSEQRAYAVEAIDLLLPMDLRSIVLPLIESANSAGALTDLERRFPQPQQTPEQWLITISANNDLHSWVRMCAQYAALQLGLSSIPVDPGIVTIVERVAMLKGAMIFSAVPDEALVLIAQQLQQQIFATDTQIFAKGDPGDCVYLVARGHVRVHDAPLTLNTLGPRDMFGEAAVLDAAARIASVTTLEPVELLRLDRDVLYQLISMHVTVAHGIIRALIRHLRGNVRELGVLDSQLRALQNQPVAPSA